MSVAEAMLIMVGFLQIIVTLLIELWRTKK